MERQLPALPQRAGATGSLQPRLGSHGAKTLCAARAQIVRVLGQLTPCCCPFSRRGLASLLRVASTVTTTTTTRCRTRTCPLPPLRSLVHGYIRSGGPNGSSNRIRFGRRALLLPALEELHSVLSLAQLQPALEGLPSEPILSLSPFLLGSKSRCVHANQDQDQTKMSLRRKVGWRPSP